MGGTQLPRLRSALMVLGREPYGSDPHGWKDATKTFPADTAACIALERVRRKISTPASPDRHQTDDKRLSAVPARRAVSTLTSPDRPWRILATMRTNIRTQTTFACFQTSPI